MPGPSHKIAGRIPRPHGGDKGGDNAGGPRYNESMSAGIYIHWPFCDHKCPYCDFTSFGRGTAAFARRDEYLAALVREIDSAPERFGWSAPPRADTVYLGGGTPSIMGDAALAAVMQALRRRFALADETEVTLELNPTSAETAGLDALLALGVNRLSVGCQSFNDRILRRLGRVHDAQATRHAIKRIKALGVANLSLDIIFGAPTQSLDDLRRDLDAMLAADPVHVSAYGLTIHEGTPFARLEREGLLALPGDGTQARMYEWLLDALPRAGLVHYEISNWARPGRESRHNLKYWRDCDVYGFGLAAHGVVRRHRLENTNDLARYLAGRGLARPAPAPSGERARRGEIMMLALRRVGGVEWTEIDGWMGTDARAYYRTELARLTAEGLLDDDGRSVRLTRRGLLLADSVMEFFF
ncbi:MAG: radical SAM family heme chaperone HemW [bacterium]|nr:radical SAM family heme chaperone HemW [bacterium]